MKERVYKAEQRRAQKRLVGLVVLFLALAPACGGQLDSEAGLENKAVLSFKNLDLEGAEKATAKVYTYSPTGKRDPFQTYFSTAAETQAASRARRNLEETETFELDQYRLTAIVTGSNEPRAMVEDPKNRGHVLRVGSRLGRGGGRVTRIGNKAIEVTEETQDAVGGKVRNVKRIQLPRSEFEQAMP